MFGMSLTEAKSNFFDTDKVEKMMDAKTRRVLRKFGGYVRKTDLNSLEYRKTSSAAGGPPSVHRSTPHTRTNKKGITSTQMVSPLKKFLYFAATEEDGIPGVVIGPVPFGGKGSATALRTIEEGGTETLIGRNGKPYPASYDARPHTGPAFRKGLGQLPSFLAGK
jgi:hypothetical protein